MKVLTEGHSYELSSFEPGEPQSLHFINKRQQQNAAGMDMDFLVTINNGTTNEEVLAVLIDRMKYLQAKFPCRENAIVITKLEESLMWLEKRTADRKNRGVEGQHKA